MNNHELEACSQNQRRKNVPKVGGSYRKANEATSHKSIVSSN
jgi:hypothetical protein